MRFERGVVFLNKLLKEGALRAVAHIRRRAATRTSFPASRRRQHDRILAKSSSGSGYQAEWLFLRAPNERARRDREAIMTSIRTGVPTTGRIVSNLARKLRTIRADARTNSLNDLELRKKNRSRTEGSVWNLAF